MIAKSTAIKGRGGKSGGRAMKAVDFTSGDLRLCLGFETEIDVNRLITAQKSAEGIVGRSDPPKA
jgi:hypothetical protein